MPARHGEAVLVQRAGVLLAAGEHREVGDARAGAPRRGCRSRRRRLRRHARYRPPQRLDSAGGELARIARARAIRPAPGRRRSPGRRGRPSAARPGSGRSRSAPSPGRTRSFVLRVGSRQSARWTPRSGSGGDSICSSGVAPEVPGVVHAGRQSAPLSSTSAAASSSELTIVQKPGELALDRLERDRHALRVALVRDRPDALEDRPRSPPGPVRKEDARRLERRQPPDAGANRLDALGRDPPGPSISGSGRIEGTAGTAVAASSPLARKRSSESSSSFISQMPDAVGAGPPVGVEVVGERLRHGRDLRDREPHRR